MRFSSALALIAAPLALAATIQEGIVRRNPVELDVRTEAPKAEAPKAESPKSEASKGSKEESNKGSKEESNKGGNNGGNSVNVINVNQKVTEIIIIWVNNGGGAATSTVNPPPVAAPAAAAATHTVIVGGSAGLVYTPDQISAAVGDMVIFEFMNANHTVTQSAFNEPCKALPGGMDSGFMSNPNNTVVPAPQMAMQVTVATPIWFYCKQKTGNHCGKGMTFSINPTADKTQAMFQGMAIAQNGTGTVAPIAGGVASPPPAAAAPAATNAVAPPPAAAAPPAVAAPPPSMAVGQGSQQGGSCSCSCLCGVASFPLAAQGVGMIGGMSGNMPMAMLEK